MYLLKFVVLDEDMAVL